MGVQFSQDEELDRISKRSLVWEYHRTHNYEEAMQTARDLGWKEKKVQVRVATNEQEVEYYIEPFEKDCDCPNILKYRD